MEQPSYPIGKERLSVLEEKVDLLMPLGSEISEFLSETKILHPAIADVRARFGKKKSFKYWHHGGMCFRIINESTNTKNTRIY